MKRTLEDILSLCREKDIRIVDFKMSDMEGRWRHLSIPVERFDENLLRYGVGFDGSNYGYAPVEASDMVFVPDLGTAAVDPFSAVPTLNLLGDVMAIAQPENHPFDQYPRNVAKRAIAHMRESGVADEMRIGPEYEFYVFDAVHFTNEPHSAGYSIEAAQAGWGTVQSAYRAPRKAGYHIDRPVDLNQDLRNEICMLLADWGVEVKYHHTEVGGCGQLEIEVEPGDMVKMADATMIVKYLVKNAALRAGKTATFLPKPVRGEAGSGMHVHMQLFRNGRPVFYDEKGYAQLSDTALWFIGGLLRHAPSLCALTNPSTNSYKRLVPGFEAPVTIGYATSNRSAVVRIPAYAKAPTDKRFELRNPDA
ncbi:MAG: glutamine synthetase beta-grasp domain-containing protein, partial [Eggerthellaceae bacterium]|nr:glutamine synthetase beta-grasp domain-containing protein [Eggerthellaceae bacterium]